MTKTIAKQEGDKADDQPIKTGNLDLVRLTEGKKNMIKNISEKLN